MNSGLKHPEKFIARFRRWLASKKLLQQHLPLFEYMYAVIHIHDPDLELSKSKVGKLYKF